MISLIILDSKKCLGIHFLYGSAPNAGLPTKINLDSLVLKVHVVPVSLDLKIYFEMTLIKVKFFFSLDRLRDVSIFKDDSIKPSSELDYSENTLQNEFCKFVPMTITSEFPHGHSLSMGRSILYYSEYICNHLESSLRTGDIVFKFSTKMNDNDDYDISITTDSMYKDSDITSVILDVFDFNLTKFTNEIKGYDVIEDITNPFNNKPWLVKDKSRDIFIV